eukprot:TRINITY_DN4289_c0_g3_i1.p1 TRINITY_DN4289_c0_g3~~TRINITY_DN4289_c0_g3_i1.p1  ORF type:complete len:2791 (+),score=1025.98 TRINITY_DN4289_c0_g3_i1:95-8467(+)
MAPQKRRRDASGSASVAPSEKRRRSVKRKPMVAASRKAPREGISHLHPTQQGKRGSQKQALAKVRVGLGASVLDSGFYRAPDAEPRAGSLGCFFFDELHELAISHTTPDFLELRGEVGDLVLTKALLMHHSRKVVAALKKRIDPQLPGFPGVVKLTYYLCRDVQKDFFRFVGELAGPMIKAAAVPDAAGLPNPTRVSSVFLAIAGWFRVLAPLAIADRSLCATLLKAMLLGLTHTSPTIARLSGEVTASLIRRVSDTDVLQHLVSVIAEHTAGVRAEATTRQSNLAITGAAVLWFESLRGVGGRWHSRMRSLLQVLAAAADAASEEEREVISLSLRPTMIQCAFHASKDTAPELIGSLLGVAEEAGTRAQRMLLGCISCILRHKRAEQLLLPPAFSLLREALGKILPKLMQEADAEDDQSSEGSASATLWRVVSACTAHGALHDMSVGIFQKLMSKQLPPYAIHSLMRAASESSAAAAALQAPLAKAVDRVCGGGGDPRKLLPILLAFRRLSATAGAVADDEFTAAPLQVAASKVVVAGLSSENLCMQWSSWKLAGGVVGQVKGDVLQQAGAVLGSESPHPVVAAMALRVATHLTSPEDRQTLEHACRLWVGPLAQSPSVAQSAAAAICRVARKLLTTHMSSLWESGVSLLSNSRPNVRAAAICVARAAVKSEDRETLLQVLTHAERGHKLRVDDLAQNRMKVIEFESIGNVVRNTDELSPDVLTVAARCLFGALHIRFRPVWGKAQEGLVSIAEKDFAAFWETFNYELGSYRNQKREELGTEAAKEEDDDDEDGSESADDADEPKDQADDGAESDGEEHFVDDAALDADQADWERAVEAETSSAESTTLLSHFGLLWELMEMVPAELVTKHSSEIFGEFQKECIDEAVVRNPIPYNTRLKSFLKVIGRFQNVDSLPIAKDYRQALWGMLQQSDADIQLLCVQGLRSLNEFRKQLDRHHEQITAMLNPKTFRDGLMRLQLDSVSSHSMLSLVFRLLRPCLWQNAHGKRNVVLSLISGLEEHRVQRFVEEIVLPAVDANPRFTPAKSRRFLDFLFAVIDQMGSRVEQWIERLLAVAIEHLVGAIGEEGLSGSRTRREAKRLCLKMVTRALDQFPSYPFSEELTTKLADALKKPLATLASAAGTAAGPLMELLRTIAEVPPLVPLLGKVGAVGPLCKVLGAPAVVSEVYCGALEVIDAVLANCGELFAPVADAFLGGVSAASTAASGFLRKDAKAWTATVETLSSAAPHLLSMATDERLVQLMSFLIDSLRRRAKMRITAAAAEKCTDVLVAVLPKMPSHDDTLRRLSPLFSSVEWAPVRVRLADAFSEVAKAAAKESATDRNVFMCGVAAVLRSTNAVDDAGGYDFETRLGAFYRAADYLKAWGGKRDKTPGTKDDMEVDDEGEQEEPEAPAAEAEEVPPKKRPRRSGTVEVTDTPTTGISFGSLALKQSRQEVFLPLSHNFSFFVGDTNQSVRTTAALALRALIGAVGRAVKRGVTGLFEAVVAATVVKGATQGVRSDDGLVRNEWMRVYGAAASTFKLTPGLSHRSGDFDFYTNITQPQAARQLKALSSLREHGEKVSEKMMERLFIPYLLRLLQLFCVEKRKEKDDDLTKSESGKLFALGQSVLQTFSAIASHLEWPRYSRLVTMLLQQQIPNQQMEKSLARCVCNVLDQFHFLGEQQVLTPTHTTPDDDDDEDEADGDVAMQDSDAKLTTRIGDDLVERVIPAVHKWWRKGNKVEDGEEKVSLARMPVAVSILRLLKFVPKDVDFVGVVETILTELISKLKTKQVPQREAARAVLCDSLTVLGASFLHKFVQLLRSTLFHGYQLHVMGYTVVSLLHRVGAEEDASKHIDGCMDTLIDILFDDYIGAGGSEKEVEELAKTMKEIKKNRALEGLELVSARATPAKMLESLVRRVQQIFTKQTVGTRKKNRVEEKGYKRTRNLEEGGDGDVTSEESDGAGPEVEDVNVDLKLQDKIRAIMRKCSRGVTKNPLMRIDDMIAFASHTLRDNVAARDSFMERFEGKQNTIKVRYTQRSKPETVREARKNAQEHWLVPDEPERKDKGFERVEVTSQCRQFGSAPKGRKGGKRRLLLPTKEGRRSLQSMDCVDELCVCLAQSLVSTEAKGVLEAVGVLAPQLLEILSGESSDSVCCATLHILLDLLRAPAAVVPFEDASRGKLTEIIFDVVERAGEVRSACFRLLSVLLLHRQCEMSPEQGMVSCSLIRTDLDKQNTFVVPAVQLLKAIVTRRIEIPEVYDLIPVLQEKMLHHSSSRVVSQTSGSVIARFLTDWRMTPKRLHSHVDFMVQNLQYPVDTGRLALLDLLEVVFQRFPDELVKKEIEYFFVPIAHRLAVDDSPQVKKKAESVLGTLFRVAGDGLPHIVSVMKKWVDDHETALVVTGLQSLNVLLSTTPKEAAPHLSKFYPEPLITLCSTVEDGADTEGKSKMERRRKAAKRHRTDWEIYYHSLVALCSVVTKHAGAAGSAGSGPTPWKCASQHLLHRHPWVRTAAARLLAAHSTTPPQQQGELVQAARASLQQLADLEHLTPGGLELGDTPRNKDPDGGPVETEIDAPLSRLAIKNFVWLTVAVRAHKTKGAYDATGLWKALARAAVGDSTGDYFRTLQATSFFQAFHTVRAAAFVRLTGALCVRMFGSSNAEAVGDLALAVADRDVMASLSSLVDFLHACASIPPSRAPLGKLAREVLSVVTQALKQESLVKLLHTVSAEWKRETAERHLAARRAASKKKADGRRRAEPLRAASKQKKEKLPKTQRPVRKGGGGSGVKRGRSSGKRR